MFSWFSNVFGKPPVPALDKMRLGPEGATHNPLMVFFLLYLLLVQVNMCPDPILHLGRLARQPELVETRRGRNSTPCRAWRHSNLAPSS